jgi:hypothetical protein
MYQPKREGDGHKEVTIERALKEVSLKEKAHKEEILIERHLKETQIGCHPIKDLIGRSE